MKRNPLRNAGKIIPNLLLLIYSLSCLYPAIWLFLSGLREKGEFNANPVALPAAPSLQHYRNVFEKSGILVWMLNSGRNTVISLVFILLLGFIIGYFLARCRFRGRNALYGYFMLGILVPIHALMVPIYVQFTKMGINNKWYTLLLPYIAFGLPICIFLVESYVRSVPIEVEEAAAIDGSSFSRTLFTIVLRMCVPILVTAGIIQFFAVWNEFSFALILVDDPGLVTVPVGVTLFKGQFQQDYPKMMAGMFVSILPTILLYFSFSKQIMKGMVAGAVKG